MFEIGFWKGARLSIGGSFGWTWRGALYWRLWETGNHLESFSTRVSKRCVQGGSGNGRRPPLVSRRRNMEERVLYRGLWGKVRYYFYQETLFSRDSEIYARESCRNGHISPEGTRRGTSRGTAVPGTLKDRKKMALETERPSLWKLNERDLFNP